MFNITIPKIINEKETCFAEKILANKVWKKEELDDYYYSLKVGSTELVWANAGLNYKYAQNCEAKKHCITEIKMKAGCLINIIYNYLNEEFQCIPTIRCNGIEKIEIDGIAKTIFINDKELNLKEIVKFTINEGFDDIDLFFEINQSFNGFIIHFTNLRYQS